MMKRLLLILLFVLLPITAYASPFLICDWYPSTVTQPSYFNVIMDGGSPVQSTPESGASGVRLHYDLASLSSGTHNATVAACNEWGCSSTVPFGFTKAAPGVPANIRLLSQ